MKKNPSFSHASMMQLLKTPEGRQLLSLVKKADPRLMQEAMKAMQSGDSAKAAALLAPLTQDKEIKALMDKIQRGGGFGA